MKQINQIMRQTTNNQHGHSLSSTDSSTSDDIAAVFKRSSKRRRGAAAAAAGTVTGGKHDFNATFADDGSLSDHCFDSTDDENDKMDIPPSNSQQRFDDILKQHETQLEQHQSMAKNVELLKRKSLALPEEKPMVRLRAYSESHGQSKVTKLFHVAGAADDEDFLEDDNDIYQKYISMKKKYKKQRRISRQFEQAITSIQDDNEEVLNETERDLKDHFEKEYELKIMRIEAEKLGDSMKVSDKLKHLQCENDKLSHHNHQLQRQVSNQASTMNIQQQIMQRSLSSASVLSLSPLGSNQTPRNSNQTPRGVCSNQTPRSQQTTKRKGSNASSINVPNFGQMTPIILMDNTTNTSTEDNYVYQNGYHINNDLYHPSSMDSGEGGAGGGGNETGTFSSTDDGMGYCSEDIHAQNDGPGRRRGGGGGGVNMEAAKKYKAGGRGGGRKKKKKTFQDFETKLMQKDDECNEKLGSGRTGWEKFVILITPSVCSCGPPRLTTAGVTTGKSINE